MRYPINLNVKLELQYCSIKIPHYTQIFTSCIFHPSLRGQSHMINNTINSIELKENRHI